MWCIAWIHPEGQEHKDKYQGFTCEKAFLADEMIVKWHINSGGKMQKTAYHNFKLHQLAVASIP